MGRFSYLAISIALALFNFWAVNLAIKLFTGDSDDTRLLMMFSVPVWGALLLATVVMNITFILAFLFPMENMSEDDAERLFSEKSGRLKVIGVGIFFEKSSMRFSKIN